MNCFSWLIDCGSPLYITSMILQFKISSVAKTILAADILLQLLFMNYLYVYSFSFCVCIVIVFYESGCQIFCIYTMHLFFLL